jgi:nucleotide-binding universal stress UspA family protein
MSITIVVPLDGSSLAEKAVGYAERLARATSGRLVLVRVTDPVLVHEEAVALAEADDDLARVERSLRFGGVPAERTARVGFAADEIVAEAAECRADLIIMGTHGRSGPGRVIYGSVADRVLRNADVPVLLVPPHVPPSWPIDARLKVLVPLDGSELAEAALEPAQAWAGRLAAELLLVQVVPWPPYALVDGSELLMIDPEELHAEAEDYLVPIAARLKSGLPSVKCRVELGRPIADIIARVGAEEHVDLFAMATHARGGLAPPVLGSVATAILNQADAPVLLVRPAPLPAVSTPEPAESSTRGEA